MYLGEAIRFSTNARVDVATGQWAVTAGSAAVVTAGAHGEGAACRLVATIADADGAAVGEYVHPAGDEATLDVALGAIPADLTAALSACGARPVWSTLFQPPSAGHAVPYVRAHQLVAWLREHAATPGGTDPDAATEHAATVRASLTHLAGVASRHASPLAAAAFIAGILTVKDAGSPVFGEFRLATNALAQAASDPHDPVFRLSIASLTAFGDTGEAAARARRLDSDADETMRAWLARLRAIG
jgi:hypothetical protein